MMNERELVERITGGEREAFSELVQNYQNMLYSAAYGVLGDFHLAQDVAQEAFVKAYMHLPSLRKPERLAGWLYAIAVRLSLNVRRGMKTDDPLELYSGLAGDGSVEEAVLRESDRRQVWEALSVLEPANRTAVVLHYFGGLTVPEIASVAEATPEAVESRIRRSRQQLKKELIHTMERVFAREKLDRIFTQKVLDRLVTREPFMLAGYYVEAPYQELGIQVRKAVAKLQGHQPGLPELGRDVYCLTPPLNGEPELPLLFIGAEIPEGSRLPKELKTVSIPQQRYIVSTFKGTLDQYDGFIRSIPSLIAEEGYEPIAMWEAYAFELYPEKTYDWSNDGAVQEIRLYWAVQ